MCTVVLCVTIRSVSHEFTWVAGSSQDAVWGHKGETRDTGQHAKCTNYCCSKKQEAAKKSQVVVWSPVVELWAFFGIIILLLWPPPSTATGEERSGNALMQKVSFQSTHIIIKSLLVSLPAGYNCAVIDLSTFVEWQRGT